MARDLIQEAGKRIRRRQSDAQSGVWHDYAGHLAAIRAGRQVDCFCISGDYIKRPSTIISRAVFWLVTTDAATVQVQVEGRSVEEWRTTLTTKPFSGLAKRLEEKNASEGEREK